jgi:AMP-binding enzyme
MSTSIEPFVTLNESSEPENLGLLHLAVERKHDRPAILRHRVATGWHETPDWRFHRHAMRIGLYLRERAQMAAGDRIALVCSLRPEWAVTQWAALTQGAATAIVDPALPDAELSAQLCALAPRAIFVEGGSVDRVIACQPAARGGASTIIALDAGGARGATESVLSWTEALDLGGSLDTAERANAARARARGLPAETPALGHAAGTNGTVAWRFLSHREVVRRVHRVWARSRIAKGDVAYVMGDAPSLATTVAVLAFTADGHTKIVVGPRENELEDIMMTRPHKIIASVETVRRMVESPPFAELSRVRKWLARAPFLPAAIRGNGAEAPPPLAGRARWLSTGSSLALAMRARARQLVTLEIDDSPV